MSCRLLVACPGVSSQETIYTLPQVIYIYRKLEALIPWTRVVVHESGFNDLLLGTCKEDVPDVVPRSIYYFEPPSLLRSPGLIRTRADHYAMNCMMLLHIICPAVSEELLRNLGLGQRDSPRFSDN